MLTEGQVWTGQREGPGMGLWWPDLWADVPRREKPQERNKSEGAARTWWKVLEGNRISMCLIS